MGYLINSGSGFMKDSVQVPGIPHYLYVTSGYSGGTNFSGYENFGTRVLADGATIESYSCVSNIIANFPTANAGRIIFDAYNLRVVGAGGSTEAKSCTITELNEIL
tara:strand:- start:36 stop:353 length:318 start_codon:yes stop_codon:yes gene_type:complete